MKKTFFTLSATLALLACSVTEQQNSLVVEVDGWADAQILAFIGDETVDTLTAQNGVVTLDVDSTADYTYVRLTRLEDIYKDRLLLDSKSIEALILKDEKVKITGSLSGDILSYNTSQFDDYKALCNKTLPFDKAADSLNILIEEGMMVGDETVDGLFDLRGDEYEKAR